MNLNLTKLTSNLDFSLNNMEYLRKKRKSITILIIFFFFISIVCISQSNFIAGYVIGYDNQRVDCKIESFNTQFSPTSIKYIPINSDSILEGNVNTIKEFGIDGVSKFITATLKLDMTSRFINSMPKSFYDNMKETTVFLKIIVEGKATLYEYSNENNFVFAYTLDGNEPKQLVYKRYLDESKNVIVERRIYQQEINNYLKLQNQSVDDINRIQYDLDQLITQFEKFNMENSLAPTSKYIKDKGVKSQINISLGLLKSDFFDEIQGKRMPSPTKSRISYYAGFQFLFNLYEKKNSLQFIINSAIQNIGTQGVKRNEPSFKSYTFLDLSFGPRYNWNIQQKQTMIFANILAQSPFTLGRAKFGDTPLPSYPFYILYPKLIYGGGVIKNRQSLEFRFHRIKYDINSLYNSYSTYYLIYSFPIK